jgi:hypothetical protein
MGSPNQSKVHDQNSCFGHPVNTSQIFSTQGDASIAGHATIFCHTVGMPTRRLRRIHLYIAYHFAALRPKKMKVTFIFFLRSEKWRAVVMVEHATYSRGGPIDTSQKRPSFFHSEIFGPKMHTVTPEGSRAQPNTIPIYTTRSKNSTHRNAPEPRAPKFRAPAGPGAGRKVAGPSAPAARPVRGMFFYPVVYTVVLFPIKSRRTW